MVWNLRCKVWYPNNFDSISSNALGAATTFALINGVISQFLTTTEDYKSAVEDGNVALAGELAVRKQAEGDIDAFGGIASGAAAAVATAAGGGECRLAMQREA